MAEINDSGDFQQMLAKLKQRVNNISTTKTAVSTQETGGDVRDLIAGFSEMLKSALTTLLDDKTEELEKLLSMLTEAAEVAATASSKESVLSELKKAMTISYDIALTQIGGSVEAAVRSGIGNTALSIREEITSLRPSITSLDVMLNKLNSIGGELITVTSAINRSIEQIKNVNESPDSNVVKGLANELEQRIAKDKKFENDIAVIKSEIESLKLVISQPRSEATASQLEAANVNMDTLRNEFISEMKDIRLLIERENELVKSQTLEFLGFITNKIVDLQGRVDTFIRLGGVMPKRPLSL